MNPENKPLWNFIPLNEYSRPDAPTGEAVRKGIRNLWERLRRIREKSEHDQKELQPVPQALLDQIAPSPCWDDAASVLRSALKAWLEPVGPENNAQVLVGAPGSGIAEITNLWARQENWRVVAAPGSDDILEGGKEWMASLRDDRETPLVFPNLASFYLRHYDGLALLERLLDWLWSSPRLCLIECDSWSWAYLSKVLQIDSAFPTPLTLEAFDHGRLQRWFRELARGAGPGMEFRQTSDGAPVLPPAISMEGSSIEPEETTEFLKNVAAYSRGIPGVARAVWRHSLRRSPDEGVANEDGDRVIWAPPWPQLILPGVPSGAGQNELFVLQELLLDGEMSADLLSKLLPISFAEATHSLHRLYSAGLLEVEDGIWRVTLLGYPAVRQRLSSAGYLVDSV